MFSYLSVLTDVLDALVYATTSIESMMHPPVAAYNTVSNGALDMARTRFPDQGR